MELASGISAVVTGGASGLGAATARALAAKGVKVGVFDLNEELGQAVASEIGGTFAKCDVSDEASVDAALSAGCPRGCQSCGRRPGQSRVTTACLRK